MLRVHFLRQNEVPVAQQIELASMPVEDSYDGPRMEGAHRTCGRILHGCCLMLIVGIFVCAFR